MFCVLKKIEQDTIAVVREHAEASADAVWKAHTDAPILAEIDHAIAAGHDQGTNAGTCFWGGKFYIVKKMCNYFPFL